MTDHTDLIPFLRAELAALEKTAFDLADEANRVIPLFARRGVLGRVQPGWHSWPTVRTQATWVLTAVRTDNRILDIHRPVGRGVPGDLVCKTCGDVDDAGRFQPVFWPCRTVLEIAEQFTDRPGFNSEWMAAA